MLPDKLSSETVGLARTLGVLELAQHIPTAGYGEESDRLSPNIIKLQKLTETTVINHETYKKTFIAVIKNIKDNIPDDVKQFIHDHNLFMEDIRAHSLTDMNDIIAADTIFIYEESATKFQQRFTDLLSKYIVDIKNNVGLFAGGSSGIENNNEIINLFILALNQYLAVFKLSNIAMFNPLLGHSTDSVDVK